MSARDVETSEVGEHHVEEHEVEMLVPRPLQTFEPSRGKRHAEPGQLEIHRAQ